MKKIKKNMKILKKDVILFSITMQLYNMIKMFFLNGEIDIDSI